MDGSGFHIALSRDHAKKLFGLKDDDTLKAVVEELKNSPELNKAGRVLNVGNTWNALHRCLTDGELDPEGGEFPLNHVVLGGKHLHQGKDYFAVLVRPDIVTFIDTELTEIKQTELRQKFFALNAESYTLPRGEKEFAELWRQLLRLRTFFEDCSQNRDAVLFTVKVGENAAAKSA